MASHPNRSSLSRAEAEFINLIEESRWKAAFPPGYPNGFIPPIEVKDTGTGEVIFLLSDDDWLDKWRQYMARTDRSPWPGGADVDATKAPDMSLEPTTPRTPLSATVRKLCRGVSSSRPEPVLSAVC
jgi:hypothetical protein